MTARDALPRKAVILARGLGTRMRAPDPATALDPAPAAVAELADAGFDEVCIVVAPEHDAIRDRYTRELAPGRVKISFAVQDTPSGTADAVLAAERFVGAEPFFALNGDNYYPVDVLAALRRVAPPAIAGFSRAGLLRDGQIAAERVARYALLDVAGDGTLRRIVEKPDAATELALRDAPVSMNCSLFTPAIFDACRAVTPSPRGELELPLAIQLAIDKMGMPVRVLPVDAPVLDLSHRADIPAVASRLARLTVDL